MSNPMIPHILVLPFPAQGHVNPLMNFSIKLCDENGFKITFVNTDFNHKRVMRSSIHNMSPEGSSSSSLIKRVSIPDGLGPEDDRNDLANLCLAISSTMPEQLEKLIESINNNNNGGDDDDHNKITYLVCDVYMAWALEIAHKHGIKGSVFCPSSAALFALELHMPKLIQDGIMDSDGIPIIKGEIELSPKMPKLNTSHVAWCCVGDDPSSPKIIYNFISNMIISTQNFAQWWLCNTTIDLEPGPLSLYPKILPIGPILIQNYHKSLGQFWEEDMSCLSWLDQQPYCSVIYIAFGSFTVFDQTQFTELALGLHLTNRPFLWVVREDHIINDGTIMVGSTIEGKKGKIVKWAPQQKVLSHPAIACFISHCGWNSTMEGVCNGVPFLCWPYFADQFYDRSYVCDAWKVGLGFEFDDDDDGRRIVSRGEIKKKVEMVLGDESMRARCVKLKEMVMNNVAQGGRSLENYNKFIEWLKD